MRMYHKTRTTDRVCITVRRHSWQPVHLCTVLTTHNSSHLAECVSSPGRLPSDHVREYLSWGLLPLRQEITLIVTSPLIVNVIFFSILHPPGNDPLGYESSSERWSPVQSIEKILLSVMSMLAGIHSFIHSTSPIN